MTSTVFANSVLTPVVYFDGACDLFRCTSELDYTRDDKFAGDPFAIRLKGSCWLHKKQLLSERPTTNQSGLKFKASHYECPRADRVLVLPPNIIKGFAGMN